MPEIRDKRRQGFFIIDNEVLDSYLTISVHGVAVYAAICRYAFNDTQEATPSIRELSEASRCSPNIVRRSVVELEKAGLVSVEGAPGSPNSYTLLKIKKESTDKLPLQGVKTTPSRREDHPLLAMSTPIKEDKTNNTNKTIPASGGLHGRIAKFIQKLHEQHFGTKCQWEGGEGKHLSDILKANPSWTEDDYERMIRNRFRSEGIAPDRPRKWLPNISSYSDCPLDRYGKKPDTQQVKIPARQKAVANAIDEAFS